MSTDAKFTLSPLSIALPFAKQGVEMRLTDSEARFSLAGEKNSFLRTPCASNRSYERPSVEERLVHILSNRSSRRASGTGSTCGKPISVQHILEFGVGHPRWSVCVPSRGLDSSSGAGPPVMEESICTTLS